jgi:hypothetical protein
MPHSTVWPSAPAGPKSYHVRKALEQHIEDRTIISMRWKR